MPRPPVHTIKTYKIPFAASIRGYWTESLAPHLRHLPRSARKLITGIISYHFRRYPQLMQWEPVFTISSFSGIRKMQTFKKLPITMPKRNMMMYSMISGNMYCPSVGCRLTYYPPPCAKQRLYVHAVLHRGRGVSFIYYDRHIRLGFWFYQVPGVGVLGAVVAPNILLLNVPAVSSLAAEYVKLRLPSLTVHAMV